MRGLICEIIIIVMLYLIKKFKIYIIALICIIILYISLKYAATYFIVSSVRNIIANESLQKQIALHNVNFEPLNLSLEIRDLELDDKSSLANLYVNFSLPNIFSKKIYISEIKVSGLNMTIVKKDGKFLINNFNHQDILPSNTNKSKNNWKVKIDKIAILESKITSPYNHNIKLKKIIVRNIDLIEKRNLMNFDIAIQINDSNIALNGNIAAFVAKKEGNISFNIDNFDLDIIDALIDNPNRGFGKVKGKFSAKGAVNLEEKIINLSMDSQLKDLFLYSQDLKMINYFIKDLRLNKLKVVNSEELFSINSPSLSIANLIFSTPSKDFKYDNLSRFSKIKINNINILKDKKNQTSHGIIKFSNGGFMAANQYGKVNKENLDIKVKNLDLTQFSKTFESLLNYQIGSGNLSIESKINFNNDKIKGTTSINLGQIYLDNENELGNKLTNTSLLPLKTVISIIKDDNGNIEANFQISGNKNNPNFNILNIIRKGVGSVLISNASSVIASKLALELAPILASSIPFSPGSALSFANGAYKIITKPRFNDIEFLTLTSKIKSESRDDLDEFVKFLEKNKKIKFQICPVASVFESSSSKDGKKISAKRALSLAQERIDILMKYFKENIGGDLSQIVFCRPKISDTNKNISIATVSL